MDKSFNDQELSDIMKEIEALEGDLGSSEDSHSEQSEDVSQSGNSFNESESEVMDELSHMPEEAVIKKTNHSESQPLSFTRSEPHQEVQSSTAMSLKVQGNLTLDLFFEVGGKTIGLEVTDSGLTIKMEGGMSFNVPIHGEKDQKKAS